MTQRTLLPPIQANSTGTKTVISKGYRFNNCRIPTTGTTTAGSNYRDPQLTNNYAGSTTTGTTAAGSTVTTTTTPTTTLSAANFSTGNLIGMNFNQGKKRQRQQAIQFQSLTFSKDRDRPSLIQSSVHA